MKVYILYKEIKQDDFDNLYGDIAEPIVTTIGVYETEAKAEKVKKNLELSDKKDVEEFGCDPCYFYIDEREVQ